MHRAFVIGGGISGLACGDALAENGYAVTVFEAEDHVGGMAATIEVDGFRFDMGPHKLYSPMPAPMERVTGLFTGGGDLLSIPKVSQLHFLGKSFGYPLSMGELLSGIPRSRALAFGASFLGARFGPAANGSYASFMRRQFGGALYDAVFGPAARKVFGEDETLSARLGEARFRGKSLMTFLRQALGPQGRGGRRIDAPTFRYPRMGTGDLPERLRRRIVERGGAIRCGAAVRRGSCGEAVRAHDGTGEYVTMLHLDGDNVAVAPDDVVIYTAALRDAPRFFGLSGADVDAQSARLKYRLLILVDLMVDRPAVMENQWMFFPASDVCFNRLSEPRNFSAAMAPDGKTSLIAEVTLPEGDLTPDAEIVGRVVADLARLGLLRPAEVIGSHVERLTNGYPVWTVGFESAREAVLTCLDRVRNLYPIGRQGLYQYVGILDCVDMALRTARFIMTGAAHEGWSYLRRELEDYPVVD